MTSRGPSFSLRALTIACTDPEQSERFYRAVLGAGVLPSDNGIGRWFRLGSLAGFLLRVRPVDAAQSDEGGESAFVVTAYELRGANN